MIIYKPLKYSYPEIQLHGGVEGIDIRLGEHDLLSTIEALPSELSSLLSSKVESRLTLCILTSGLRYQKPQIST